ncbi:MAG TPA: serine/threonine-protein kinase [Ktedonobacterales bacterium]|jgi:WD40 repeat protein
MADFVGRRLGNYRLVRLLGQGGFAQVYLGEHVRLGTQAAIKLLAAHLADVDVEKFLAEAQTIARLEHPHIIRILDFDVADDIAFLVMQLAPNGTLRKRYPRGTRLPLETVLAYLKQAADALQYAHDARVIHRDIKPENLLLGWHDTLLLSDFGIAVMAHSSRSQSIQEISGTAAYMAPEQIQGKPRPATDQYALGVIVYEWLCGALPFSGTPSEVAMQHLHAVPPPLYEQIPSIPPAIETVVLKALEKDPHQRFASVQEFAAAFEKAYQDTMPATTALPTNLPSQHSFTASTPAQAASYSDPTIAESKLLVAAPAKRRISRRKLLVGAAALVGVVCVGGGLLILPHQKKPALGTTILVYTGHLNVVAGVAWSPDSSQVASASSDGTVQVWDARIGMHPFIYRGHTTNINAVAWAPAPVGQRIASASGNSFFGGEHVVQVWDAETGAHSFAYQGHTQPVRAVAWSPGGKLLASGSEDKTVQVWDASNGSHILSYIAQTAAITGVAWSPDGKYIASASNDTTVHVWNARTAEHLFSLAHTSTVNAVAWSPDGTRIASASGNLFLGGEHAVQVWDAATGKHLLTYSGHPSQVNTVTWSPDSKRLASASSALDKNVQVWDAHSGATLYTYHGHTLGINAVAWSPDGQLIASASSDGTVRVWQAS